MAKPMEEWLDTDVSKLEKLPLDELGNIFFFRDPMRPNYIDNEHFYSPAEGTILYQKYIEDPNSPVVEVKGKKYTL
jgi:phosphatidylserine decarboxylase